MLADAFWVSVGVQYLGPTVGHDSIVTLSVVTGGGIQGTQEMLLRPLGENFTGDEQQRLTEHDLTVDAVLSAGWWPTDAVNTVVAELQRRAHGRNPILLIADTLGEQYVRWYFQTFAGFDPFAQSQEVLALSAEWNAYLRGAMAPSQYQGRPARSIAEDQFVILTALLAERGHF